MKKHDKTGLWFFLIGLGTYTQVVVMGCIGLSELVLFALAPFIWWQDRLKLKRDGFTPMLWLLLAAMAGCVLSTAYNGHPILGTIKVQAQYYSFFACLVVCHRLLLRDARGIRWLFVGLFLSSVISIFVLNPALNVSAGTVQVVDQSAEDIVAGEMFWMGRLRSFMEIFTSGFYFQTPLFLNAALILFYVIFLAKTTATGRSASLMVLSGLALMVLAGKKYSRMRTVARMFWILFIVGAVALFGLKAVYKKAALSGFMGEAALGKYETQTEAGDSMLKILMSGRKEFFIGLSAAIDRPLLGFGFPSIDDRVGYVARFMIKYGSDSDLRTVQRMQREGVFSGYLPSHSYMIGAWHRCGIVGLILWLYVLYLCIGHLRKYLAVIPQWYGYFAIGVPTIMWNIFFSPFNERFTTPLLICCMLFARAVAMGRVMLPFEMIADAERHNR